MDNGCNDLLNFLDNNTDESGHLDPNMGLGIDTSITNDRVLNNSTIVNLETDDYKMSTAYSNSQLVTDISPLSFSETIITDSEIMGCSQPEIQLDHDYFRRSSSPSDAYQTSTYTDSIPSPTHSETMYEPQYQRETTSPMSTVSSENSDKSPLNTGIEDICFNEMDMNNMDFTNMADEDILQTVLKDADISLDLDLGMY